MAQGRRHCSFPSIHGDNAGERKADSLTSSLPAGCGCDWPGVECGQARHRRGQTIVSFPHQSQPLNMLNEFHQTSHG